MHTKETAKTTFSLEKAITASTKKGKFSNTIKQQIVAMRGGVTFSFNWKNAATFSFIKRKCGTLLSLWIFNTDQNIEKIGSSEYNIW